MKPSSDLFVKASEVSFAEGRTAACPDERTAAYPDERAAACPDECAAACPDERAAAYPDERAAVTNLDKPSPHPERPLRIALVAGELSGDILGAGVIEALKAHAPEARFFGIGGPGMIANGLEAFAPIEALSVMGLTEVLRHLPRLLRLRRDLSRAILNFQPDVFIGIDAPDFNLTLERRLKQKGIRTVHLGCPTIWAWRRGRVRTLRKAVDLLLTLFPFEPAILAKEGLPAEYIGHPLADQLIPVDPPALSRPALELDVERPVVGILPGSRRSEVSRLLPPFLDLVEQGLAQTPAWQFVIPAATKPLWGFIANTLAQRGLTQHVRLVDGNSRAVMQASDVLVLASGTAALEAMLLGRPMMVCYRLSTLSAFILQRMLYVPHFSLPNILAGDAIVPELVQDEVNGPALHAQVVALMEKGGVLARQQLDVFNTLRPELRRNASHRAAEAILGLIRS